MLLFEWDPNKARKNLEIHGVSFDKACTAFKDTLSLTIRDPLHSDEEDRFIFDWEFWHESSSGSCSYGKRREHQNNKRKESH